MSRVTMLEDHIHVSGRALTVLQVTTQRKSPRNLLGSDQLVILLVILFKVAKFQLE